MAVVASNGIGEDALDMMDIREAEGNEISSHKRPVKHYRSIFVSIVLGTVGTLLVMEFASLEAYRFQEPNPMFGIFVAYLHLLSA